MLLDETLKDGEELLARTWKTMAVRGSLAIAFGVVALAWPSLGLTTLIALFAATALLTGGTAIAGAVSAPRGSHRGWLAADGVLALAVGTAVLVWPDLSARALLFLIASWAVASGALVIGLSAFALPASGGRSLLPMLWGIVSVAFGVIMFARPGAGAVGLVALVSAFAIVTGTIQLTYALELRRAARDLGRAMEPMGQDNQVPTRTMAHA
jgi:uncharacterized membrane protein HdeD (DUF308 family)